MFEGIQSRDSSISPRMTKEECAAENRLLGLGRIFGHVCDKGMPSGTRCDNQFCYKLASTSRTTEPVRSRSSALCAVDMNPVSN